MLRPSHQYKPISTLFVLFLVLACGNNESNDQKKDSARHENKVFNDPKKPSENRAAKPKTVKQVAPTLVKDHRLIFTDIEKTSFKKSDFKKWRLSGRWIIQNNRISGPVTFSIKNNMVLMKHSTGIYQGGLVNKPPGKAILLLSRQAEHAPPSTFFLNLFSQGPGKIKGVLQVFAGKMSAPSEVFINKDTTKI